MANYEVLNQLPEGTNEFEIPTTFKGFAKTSRRSGHTPPGDKLLETVNLTLEPKVNKAGRNIHLECRVVEDGTVIHKYMPAPIEDTDVDAGYRMWRQYVEAVLSYAGVLDANVGQSKAVRSQDLIGKQFAARIVDGEGDYAQTSGIERFLSRADWETAQAKQTQSDRVSVSGNGASKEAIGKALFQ